MVGTTLFTVSRLLSAWESDGLIESGRARIVVRRPDRLSAIAEGGERANLGVIGGAQRRSNPGVKARAL